MGSGQSAVEDLFSDIPPELRFGGALRVPDALPEAELTAHLAELAVPNTHLDEAVCFLGGGACDHYVPAVVDLIADRVGHALIEPDSPQPLLQLVFELQLLFQRLVALDAAMAPLPDGPTALVEAIRLAVASTGRRRVVVARALNPAYRAIARTTLPPTIEVAEVGYHGGVTRPDHADRQLGDAAACLVVEQPNYFGCIEDLATLADVAHRHGALLVVKVDPIAVAILTPPGAVGADVAAADAQPLGSRPSWGGGSAGLLACRADLAGHAASWQVGRNGDCFQSTGCATAPLPASRVARPVAYLAALGADGLTRAARLCLARAHEMQRRICSIDGFDPRFRAPFFKEFVVESAQDPEDIAAELLDSNVLGAVPLQADYPEMDHCALFAATERRTPTDITMLTHALDLMVDLSDDEERP